MTLTSPDRSRMGRENSVESLWMKRLPCADRRAGAGRRQRAVDAATAELRPGRPAPDPGELGALDRLEATGADDLPVDLGDPQLQVVARAEAVQDLLVVGRGVLGVVAEDLGLHGQHRRDVGLVASPVAR